MAFGFSKQNAQRIAESVKRTERGIINPVDPRRQRPIGVGGSKSGLFVTHELDDEGYPYSGQTYRCYPADLTSEEIAELTEDDFTFIQNITSNTIPEGTEILAWKIGGTWYTSYPSVEISVGTTTADTTYNLAEVDSVDFNNPLHLLIPAGFEVATSGSDILFSEPTFRMALLTSDVGASTTGAGAGTGNIQDLNSGAWITRHEGVTIQDFQGIGALNGQRVPVMWIGSWVLIGAGCA